MKRASKLINSIIIVSLFLSCSKQSENQTPVEDIPNAGFENWGTLDGFDKPDTWETSNFSLFSVVSFNTVTKDIIEKYSGIFCPRLETKSQYIDNVEVKVAGLLTLGSFDINIETRKATVSGGIPFEGKPITFEGFYKYNGVGIDRCYFNIVLTRFNAISNNQDTIGHGTLSSGSISSWTPFKIPIEYLSNDAPESMNIVILSSDTTIFEPGSTLWVDNLILKY